MTRARARWRGKENEWDVHVSASITGPFTSCSPPVHRVVRLLGAFFFSVSPVTARERESERRETREKVHSLVKQSSFSSRIEKQSLRGLLTHLINAYGPIQVICHRHFLRCIDWSSHAHALSNRGCEQRMHSLNENSLRMSRTSDWRTNLH